MQPDDANPADEPEEYIAHLDDLRHSIAFIDGLKSATHTNGPLDEETVERLRHPPQHEVCLADADILKSLGLYMELQNSSQSTYTSVRDVLYKRYPEDKTLSLYEVEKKIAELTGVVPVLTDMCPGTCIAY
ncbi:uncharacterized protein B0H18DRAFT_890784, partial [Fomitopsis serialis]|uniref:uncharacterized protein n=1 Tax=Fomitopsis serialis TaxID=139415 RepID=UPI002008219E